MQQFENVAIRVSSIITIRTQIEKIKEIIYDIRFTMFEMCQFENLKMCLVIDSIKAYKIK